MRYNKDMEMNKEKFQAWLESKDKDEVVGVTLKSCDCPMSVYLKEETGFEVSLSQLGYSYLKDGELLYGDIPNWTENFITTVNNMYSKGESREVTARQALYALNNPMSFDED